MLKVAGQMPSPHITHSSYLGYLSNLARHPCRVAFPQRNLTFSHSPPQPTMSTPRYLPYSFPLADATNVSSVHTYHCTSCSHLLLATTHLISSLPTRRAPGLDHATIVPLPAPPKSVNPSSTEEADSDDEDRDEQSGYTLLLTLTRDRAAKVIAREDGFEKRVLWRCGRCKLVVGYMLDEAQYVGKEKGKGERRRAEERFLYLLPGAVTESGELGKEQEAVELI
jgi:hypothetical protein